MKSDKLNVYDELAINFWQCIKPLHKSRVHKGIFDSLEGEVFLLQHIMKNDGVALPSELCHEGKISSARVAATLKSLEQKGLISRELDIKDHRKVLVKLTIKGKKVASDKYTEIKENIIELLSTLKEEDAREYVRITEVLANNLFNKGKE